MKEKSTKKIKTVYDEEFKLKVINYAIESGARYKDIKEKFNVPRTTFNLWINKLKTTNKELYDTYKKIIDKKHHENRGITLTLNAIKNYPKNKNRGEINSVEDFNNLLIKMANDLLDTKSDYGYLERKYEIPRNLISKYFNTKLPKLDKELYEKVLYRNNLNLMKGVSKAVAINKNRLIEYHKKETEKKNLYQKNVNDIVLEMRKKNRK